MDEIVSKVAEAELQGRGRLRGFDVEASIHVQGKTIGGQKKTAEAWVSRANGDLSRWRLHCDEGKNLGGEDSAPPPLVYFGAAIAF